MLNMKERRRFTGFVTRTALSIKNREDDGVGVPSDVGVEILREPSQKDWLLTNVGQDEPEES
jgi:hypothetical protein